MTHTQLIAQLEDSLNQLEALKASTQHTLAMALMSDTLKRLESMRKEPEALWRYLAQAVEALEWIGVDGPMMDPDTPATMKHLQSHARNTLDRLQPWTPKDGTFGSQEKPAPLAHGKYASDNMVLDEPKPGEGSGQ
jgi:hypothetical protein